MAQYSVGTSVLHVVPDFTGLQTESKRMANKIRDDLQAAIRDGLKGTGAVAPAAKTGATVGRTLAEQIKSRLEVALRSLPKVEITANTSPAQREVQLLRTNIETLTRRVGVDLSTEDAAREVELLEARLKQLAATSTDIDIKANTDQASRALAAIREEVARLKALGAEVKVTANTGAFATKVKAALEEAQAALPDIVVDATTAPAQREIAALRADMAALADKRIGVDIDAAAALAELEALKARADALGASSPDIDVRTDAAAASAALARVQAQADRLNGSSARVDVDSAGIDTFSGRLANLIALGATLAPALLPGLAAVTLGLGGLGAAAGAVVPALGSVILGLKGVGGALSAVTKAEEQSAQKSSQAANTAASAAQAAVQRAQARVSAARSVQGAEASLASAQDAAASSAVRSAAAVVKAQQGVADAVRHVADAQQAVVDAQTEAAYSADQQARRVTQATDAVTKAETAGADAVRRAFIATVTARQGVATATEQAADRVKSALATQAQAERTLATAQRTSLQLQQDLNDARLSASQSLEDQELRLQDLELQRRQGILSLADAQERLAKVMADPTHNADDIAAAQLGVDSAQQQMKELEVTTGRLQTSYQKAQAAGVDGSDAVVSAQQRITDQVQAVADAQDAVAAAAAASAKAQTDGAKAITAANTAVDDANAAFAQAEVDRTAAIAAAQDDLTQAQVEQARAATASARTIADAQQGVLDAQGGVADAQQRVADAQVAQTESARSGAASVEAAVRSLAGAQDQLKAAYDRTGAAGVVATDAVATAMAKLSPVQQQFVDFLLGLRPQLSALQDASAAGLLPGLTAGISALLPIMPTLTTLFQTFGASVGDLFKRAGEGLASPEWQGFLAFLITNGPAIMTTLGTIVGNVLGLLPALAKAFGPTGQIIGDALVKMTGAFTDFIAGLADSPQFQQFVQYALDNAPAVSAFFGALGDAFVNIIRSMAPMGPVLLGIITGLLNFIAAIPPGVLQFIVTAILGIFGAFNYLLPIITAVSGVVSGFIATLGAEGLGAALLSLLGPVGWIILAVVALVAAFVAAYQHSETFRDIVQTAIGAVRDFIVSAWQDYILPALTALGDFILNVVAPAVMSLWENYVKPAFQGIGDAVQWAWQNVLKPALSALVWYWQNVLQPALLFLWHNVFEPAWDVIAFVVKVAYNTIKLALDLLVFYWQHILQPALEFLWHNVFTPIWSAISDTVNLAWSIIKLALDALVYLWTTKLQPALTTLQKTYFEPVWSAIGTAVDVAWTKVIKPALDALAGFFTDTLGPAVSKGVGAFTDAWNLIRNAALEPINWVITNVYTNGIQALFKKVADAVGSDAKLPDLQPIPMYQAPQKKATGGRIHGYSPTKTADNVPVMATAGEFMQPVDSVNYYGHGFMEAVRKRRFPRDMAQGLASGGSVQDLVSFGRKLQTMGFRVSEHPQFGGVHPVHAKDSWHYKNGAVDINWAAGQSAAEMAAIDQILPTMANSYGLRSIWRYPEHYNHGHADIAGTHNLGAGSSSGPSGGGFLSGLTDSLGSLWDGAKDLLSPFTKLLDGIKAGVGDSTLGAITGGAARKTVGLVTDWVKSKAGDLFGGSGDTTDGPSIPYSGQTGHLSPAEAKAAARTMLPQGWNFGALEKLWQGESGWSWSAQNPHSPAYGIPQSLPGSKMASAGKDWHDNAVTQISWGLDYIRDRYGNPTNALAKWTDRNPHWYAQGGLIRQPLLFDQGGMLPVGYSTVLNATGRPEPLARMDQPGAGFGASSGNVARLLEQLVDLAGDGNTITESGLSQLAGAIADQPRRAQQLSRQGAR